MFGFEELQNVMLTCLLKNQQQQETKRVYLAVNRNVFVVDQWVAVVEVEVEVKQEEEVGNEKHEEPPVE